MIIDLYNINVRTININNNIKTLHIMEKIYIAQFQINEESELPIVHIEHVFNDINKAKTWLENNKEEIENKTSCHFVNREGRWIDVELVEEYAKPQIHIAKALTYKWVHSESGETMYTHFKILEYDVE